MAPEEFRRCDKCQQERRCRQYKDLWLCDGPSHCWRKRASISRKEEAKR